MLISPKPSAYTKASATVPGLGIPDMAHYGDPASGLRRGDLVKYVLQHHQTTRNPTRPHYDLRLGTPATGLYSWAVPRASMPRPGEKALAAQTQVHAYGYGDFTGKIGRGYGSGTVTMADNGKALITKISGNHIAFTLADAKTPVRYNLVRTSAPDMNGRANWLLMGVPVGKGVEGVVGVKPKIKLIQDKDLGKAMASATSVQAKIDGAHEVYAVNDKGDIEAYSVNKSVAGAPIVHSERLGLAGLRIPELAGTTFRGEAFGTRKGKSIPFNQVSGILNSSISKAIETQSKQKIRMQNAPFAVERYQGRPVAAENQQQVLDELFKSLPASAFVRPETVYTPEAAQDLLNRIRAGTQAQTQEGVILNTPTGSLKYKIRPEITAFLRGVFSGTGKRRETAGGLLVGLKPDQGPDIRVGTGFTDAELADIASNLKSYVGKPIRIGHQGEFASGLLRAPSYLGMEVQ